MVKKYSIKRKSKSIRNSLKKMNSKKRNRRQYKGKTKKTNLKKRRSNLKLKHYGGSNSNSNNNRGSNLDFGDEELKVLGEIFYEYSGMNMFPNRTLKKDYLNSSLKNCDEFFKKQYGSAKFKGYNDLQKEFQSKLEKDKKKFVETCLNVKKKLKEGKITGKDLNAYKLDAYCDRKNQYGHRGPLMYKMPGCTRDFYDALADAEKAEVETPEINNDFDYSNNDSNEN